MHDGRRARATRRLGATTLLVMAACTFDVDRRGARFLADAAPVDANAADAFLGGGTLVRTYSFQDGTVPDVGYVSSASPADVSVADAPWDLDRKALKLTIRAGQNTGSYPRSDFGITHGLPGGALAIGTRHRLTGAFWFDPGSDFGTSEIQVVASVQNGVSSPPVAMSTEGGDLRVSLFSDQNPGLFPYGPVPTGARVPFEIVYEPQLDETGYVRVSIGDRVVVDRFGGNMVASEPSMYVILSLADYSRTVATELSVYLDDLLLYEY
jgi:hypothetical protein